MKRKTTKSVEHELSPVGFYIKEVGDACKLTWFGRRKLEEASRLLKKDIASASVIKLPNGDFLVDLRRNMCYQLQPLFEHLTILDRSVCGCRHLCLQTNSAIGKLICNKCARVCGEVRATKNGGVRVQYYRQSRPQGIQECGPLPKLERGRVLNSET